MTASTLSTRGVCFLVCCLSALFVASKPLAYAACVKEFQEDCDNDQTAGLHHRMRRSIQSSWQRSQSLKVDFLPLVQNVTYYNTLDRISFSLNLTHNQSVSVDITKNIKVVLSSQYLTPVENSLQTQVGSVAGVSYNSSSISFNITSLTQSDLVSVSFMATVTASIHPLANLYFTVLVWGQNSGDSYLYYGPIPSQPTQYAVFPKVTLTRTSVSYLWVGNTTGYSMNIIMPKLNFSLLVEITTNINDFSFMELHDVKVKSVGGNIKTTQGLGTLSPSVLYDSSEEVPFNDRAVLDFGNLTVHGSDNNEIVIDYNVTIRDHPMLANDSKHWVGAGMRSGYQMLWVGQEALYVYKSEPALTANFTTPNDTARKRYLIGDRLLLNWVVQHTYNTSYEDAKDVRISLYSNTLKFLNGTYDTPTSQGNPLLINDAFHTGEISVPTLAQGNQVTGSLTLEVSKNISPLETLDVFLKLKYKNARGDDKLNTTHKLSHAFVAGVPSFFLKLNASTNRIRIGGRAKFWFDILLRKMVSTLKVEVILPVNKTSIMSLVSLKVNSVGKNIANNSALTNVKAQLNSTVGDQKLYDRGTLDFGVVENVVGDADHPDNKIMMEFEIIVNDHANVTNGSKHWVGVGVRGGKRMMWVGDVALIADVPQDRRPVLQVSATCALPGTQLACKDASSLTRNSTVYFNGTVYHDTMSQQYAENVNVFWMMPPYVKFAKLDHDPELIYQFTEQGPKFNFNKKMHFLNRLSFSIEGSLDPNGLMPPGDTYAVSPIQLSYSAYSVQAVFGAPLVPVSLKFRSPGNVAPETTLSDLPEIYKRGFLLDSDNKTVYICQQSSGSSRLQSSCFSTSDEGTTWIAMDQQVCHVIGQDGDEIFGIACNNRAYMRKKGPQGAWYGIPKEDWQNAMTKNSGIDANLVKINEDYSHSDHPKADKTKGTSPRWGANAKGVYIDSGGWKMKAQWKCCGN